MRKLTLFLALTLGLAACSDDPASPEEQDNTPKFDTTVAYPLKVGNSWTIETRDLINKIVQIDTHVIRLDRDTLIDGVHYFVIAGRDPTVLRNDSLGTWARNYLGMEWLQAPYRAELGDTVPRSHWEHAFVRAIDTPITVRAGSFNCVLVRTDYLSSTQYQYFTEGVGEVLTQSFRNADGLETNRRELLTYVVK